ncbi:MAG: hypothetical protein L0H99_10475 [Loigolactobacillus coryniformis]|uniref:hypothetical protein n=1 Tax=Loigolactobacillus coryniformis TaxID=1610 RepID=UPI002647C417|nr:hypothetical protein [Loigolactobacillus coryniformis]MDN5954316.1 hypothetical protein [Loigolactobacillus coryniformis]
MKKYYRYLRSGILPFACLLLFVHLGNQGLIIQITDRDFLLLVNLLFFYPLATIPFVKKTVSVPIDAFHFNWEQRRQQYNLGRFANVLPYNILAQTPNALAYSTGVIHFFIALLLFLGAPILWVFGVFILLRRLW